MFLGGPQRIATGCGGHAILNGLAGEVNVKVDKRLVLGKVLQLLRKSVREVGIFGDSGRGRAAWRKSKTTAEILRFARG